MKKSRYHLNKMFILYTEKSYLKIYEPRKLGFKFSPNHYGDKNCIEADLLELKKCKGSKFKTRT